MKKDAKKNPVICIDGPAGAGKSTVAKAISGRIGFLYVDSGSLYRGATVLAGRAGVDFAKPEEIAAYAERLEMAFEVRHGSVVYLIDGREPGDEIRTPEVNKNVSPVSAEPAIRARVTAWLRGMRALGPLVVEGRDIGSVVFPESPARFYLDADPLERARRRLEEDVARGLAKKEDLDAILASIERRDRIDSSRKAAPLKVPEGSIVVDSTHLGVEEVVARIIGDLPEEWKRGR